MLSRLTTSLRVTAIWISLTSYLLGHVQRASSQGKGNLFKSFSRDLIALIPASRASLITFLNKCHGQNSSICLHPIFALHSLLLLPYLSAAPEPATKLQLTTSPRIRGPRLRPSFPLFMSGCRSEVYGRIVAHLRCAPETALFPDASDPAVTEPVKHGRIA